MNRIKRQDELRVRDSYAPQIAAKKTLLAKFFGTSVNDIPTEIDGGVDSEVFRRKDGTLLKVFAALAIRSNERSCLPQHVLQWYFEQSREVAAFLKLNPNPLNQSLIDTKSGETYTMNYRVSDPGSLHERNGLVSSVITDVCHDKRVPSAFGGLNKVVLDTQRFLVPPDPRLASLIFQAHSNSRYRVDEKEKIIYVTFTDIVNDMVALYSNKKGLLSGPKSLISKRTRERVAAST